MAFKAARRKRCHLARPLERPGEIGFLADIRRMNVALTAPAAS